MSTAQEILGQDEIDALIHGVGSGNIPTEAPPARDEARQYDFSHNTRIVRGRMPTLEMINERFGRLLRTSIYNLLRRAPVISVGSVQIVKFAEYVRTLHLPTSLNLVKFSPLRGTGLVILDPKLVFALVDLFFGGKGRHAKIEGREFTAIENQIIDSLLNSAFANIHEAWAHIADLTVEKIGSEMNPHFANIVSPTEIVVVTRFGVELDGAGGDFHITMPYSMIEPLREVLDSGMQSDRVEQDDRWSQTLKHEVGDAPIEVRALLGHTTLKLSELMNIKAGDVLSTDFAGTLTLIAEDIPMFRGTYGLSHGQQAVKIEDLIRRMRPGGSDVLAAKRQATAIPTAHSPTPTTTLGAS
ncbi:MAG: flagellar motor switch protein FliM [Gammaproteobacteria bacterium]|jgi:flagellar motor switch protein FliM|nr:flagellar motor switch protein FliM [Gammaproteobacteria bacterium]